MENQLKPRGGKFDIRAAKAGLGILTQAAPGEDDIGSRTAALDNLSNTGRSAGIERFRHGRRITTEIQFLNFLWESAACPRTGNGSRTRHLLRETAILHTRKRERPSSTGQDVALSRRRSGFDSRRAHQALGIAHRWARRLADPRPIASRLRVFRLSSVLRSGIRHRFMFSCIPSGAACPATGRRTPLFGSPAGLPPPRTSRTRAGTERARPGFPVFPRACRRPESTSRRRAESRSFPAVR